MKKAQPNETSVAESSGSTANPVAPILVAEDNELNFELIRDLLVAQGYPVVRAADGEEALRLARGASYRALLLDLHMPKLSGLEVLRALRSDPDTKELKILILSADVMHGVEEAMAAGGANAFLPKPFDLPDFFASIEALLR